MKKIEYKGVKTNNLKNIDVHYYEGELILICGESGSGKSSLAFDTIAAISQNEFDKLSHDNTAEIKFDVDYYSNVIPAVSLKQLNFNVNPRSTIMSYFGLYKPFSLILNELCGISMNDLSPNGVSRCKTCNGLGYMFKPSANSIIAYDKKINEMPFLCWNNSYKDYYKQILCLFCKEMNIDVNQSFSSLPEHQQNILLSGIGKIKHKITYKYNGKLRTKTSVYYGPLVDLELSNSFISNRQRYMMTINCETCEGTRLNSKVSSIIVKNKFSLGDLLTCPLSSLNTFLNSLDRNTQKNSVRESIDYLLRFTSMCKKLSIDYLNLSRSIPSLSGGELQRLRIVQLLMGRIDHLLTIIDEPTASLHPIEAEKVIHSILELNANNTVMLVEHHNDITKIADRIIYLGPHGGKNGGNIISEQQYIDSQKYDLQYKPLHINKLIKIPLESSHVNFGGNIQFALHCVNGICGQSGIGKTTILKDILPTLLDDYKYFSQKPILGTSFTTVASYTGILDEIRNVFSKSSKQSKGLFSNHSEGSCPKCQGSGKILIGDFYDEKIYESCDKCHGTGYSEKALNVRVKDLNIAEILNLEISALFDLEIKSKKLNTILLTLKKLDLGHLKLNQKISSLSGGENQRLKLCLALIEKRNKIIGLDEPTKGLSERAVKCLIDILYEDIANNQRTYIIAEHNPIFLSNCTFINELSNISNQVKVICSGTADSIKNNYASLIKKWLI